MNSSHTDRLSAAMRGSRNFRHGGGGVHVNLTKKTSDSVVCLFLFVAFFLVLGLFYRSQMVNFKEKYHFSRFRRGSKFFQGGGGGGNCLLPIETQTTCNFPGGPDPLAPPLWIRTRDPHLAAIYLVSQSAKWWLAHVLVFLQLRCMFSVKPRNKIVSWTYCMTVAWFIQHPLQFVFAFFNHSIKIAQFLFAGGHFFSFPSHFDRWCFSSPM